MPGPLTRVGDDDLLPGGGDATVRKVLLTVINRTKASSRDVTVTVR